MTNWDDSRTLRRDDKWAKWTMKPQRQTAITIKHVSAMVFVLTAGVQLAGVVA